MCLRAQSATTVEIDLERVVQMYSAEGAWYPYQIASGNFTIILDDDGSLFVSTRHLSDALMKDAKELLNTIAAELYSH